MQSGILSLTGLNTDMQFLKKIYNKIQQTIKKSGRVCFVTGCLLHVQFAFNEKDTSLHFPCHIHIKVESNHIRDGNDSSSVWKLKEHRTVSTAALSVSHLSGGRRDFCAKWTIYGLPAHDFMSEKNSAHFWILVLTFINYGLRSKMTWTQSKHTHALHILENGKKIYIKHFFFSLLKLSKKNWTRINTEKKNYPT